MNPVAKYCFVRRAAVLIYMIVVICFSGVAHADKTQARECPEQPQTDAIRIATFNTSLSHKRPGAMLAALKSGKHQRARNIADIIQIIRPDILLLNEFDYDSDGQAARWFQEKYLNVTHTNTPLIDYPYMFNAPSNTGLDSGFDLDNDDKTGGPADAFGFGQFPGQYGMLVLSRFPFEDKTARTFQRFLWKDMPNALIPTDWYTPDEVAHLRLSSKSHWDIPIVVNGERVHLLASHPTPPVFDGPEDRNGKRNHDEIRFWADYIDDAAYITDDSGQRGGIGSKASRFVIVGDLNADPNDGDSHSNAARLLTQHPLINNDITPASRGGVLTATQQGGANATHQGNPMFDTSDFSDTNAGNLRVDYVLPSLSGMDLLCASVYWPMNTTVMSDHRPVYIDVVLH